MIFVASYIIGALLLASLHGVSGQTAGFLDYVYYNDPNCELGVSLQNLDIVDYCLQDQDSSGNPNGTSFYNHYSTVKGKNDGSYQLKKINYNSLNCTGQGIVGVVIPGQLGNCTQVGSTGTYKTTIYSLSTELYNVGTFGYRESYFTSSDSCSSGGQVTTEKTYQQNACIVIDENSSKSYSCVNNGASGALTTTTFADVTCNFVQSVVTQPLPLECSKGNNVGSNQQNYMYQSCVYQSLPTGYILTNSFAGSDCTSTKPYMKAYYSVGKCYQSYNTSSNVLQLTGSYMNVYIPGTGDMKWFTFDDGRCTQNRTLEKNVPATTECAPSSSTNVPTYSSAYVNGPTITADADLPLVISYYPTAVDCTSASAPSTEYHFADGTCIVKGGVGTKYSYANGQFTKTTYADTKCTTGANSTVMTDTKCLSHAGEHTNSEQQFESLAYNVPPTPPPPPPPETNTLGSANGTGGTLAAVLGSLSGILLLIVVVQFYQFRQKKLAMAAAEENITKSGIHANLI